MTNTFMSSISFKEYYLEQLVYLEMQHSKSNFICELLKRDMIEKGISIPKEEIERYLNCKKNKEKYTPNRDILSDIEINHTHFNQPTINQSKEINDDKSISKGEENHKPSLESETIDNGIKHKDEDKDQNKEYKIDPRKVNFFANHQSANNSKDE